MILDNIVIGKLVEGLTLEQLGISEDEDTIFIDETKAAELKWFLPRILVDVGVFKTTSQVKSIDKQRFASNPKLPDEQRLWRSIDRPEMTNFKIGKKVFWLVVGDLNK